MGFWKEKKNTLHDLKLRLPDEPKWISTYNQVTKTLYHLMSSILYNIIFFCFKILDALESQFGVAEWVRAQSILNFIK